MNAVYTVEDNTKRTGGEGGARARGVRPLTPLTRGKRPCTDPLKFNQACVTLIKQKAKL